MLNMNARQYHALYGVAKCREVCDAAGITMKHFYALIRGDRYPSRRLARRLEVSSGAEITFNDLLSYDPPPKDIRTMPDESLAA